MIKKLLSGAFPFILFAIILLGGCENGSIDIGNNDIENNDHCSYFLSYEIYKYDSDNDGIFDNKHAYTYYSNGNVASEIWEYDYDDDEIIDCRHTYTYDSEGNSRNHTITDYRQVGRSAWRTATSDRSPTPLIADHWCQTAYLHPASPVIHSLGLTEPFLARTRMHSDRPAHKFGLRPLAEDLLNIRCQYGFVCGAFDNVMSDGRAFEKHNLSGGHSG